VKADLKACSTSSYNHRSLDEAGLTGFCQAFYLNGSNHACILRTHYIDPIPQFQPRRAALSIGDPDLWGDLQRLAVIFSISIFCKTDLAAISSA